MKKMLSILLTFAFVFVSMTGGCAAEPEKSSQFTLTMQIGNPVMTVNGVDMPIDEQGTVPVIVNDRTLLPVRAVIEQMGGTVGWNGETEEVTLTYGEDEIKLTIGSTEALLNGETRTLDVAPAVMNDRTMLPARFVCENLSAEVTWDSVQKQVIITGKHLKTGADLRIVITIGASTATVNNQTVALDAPAFISDNRTYTPIRFICESLGADVTWNSTNQQIIITK